MLRTCCLMMLLAVPCAAQVAPAEPITPVPATLGADPARAALGRRLFHDVRLSGNGSIACASCHDVPKGGADTRARSQGIRAQLTELNAPTVLNAALNFRQFWNGRAATLEQQVGMVVENPIEMGARWPEVVGKVHADPAYRRDFAAAYRDGVTRANIESAIATYEKTLITPNSRFDRFLLGQDGAISSEEKEGYARFKRFGCIACHQGVNVGGNMYQKFGVLQPHETKAGASVEAGLGRYLVTRLEEDRHVFKVPGLRNVGRTAPYFHDASAATLEQAIEVMFHLQLGRPSSKRDTELIAKFLRTLDAAPVGQP